MELRLEDFMKHTPAPWEIQRHDIGPYYGNVVGHYTERKIRTITIQLKYGTDEENEANAQLISAAPDLLEALIMVRDADNDCRADGLEAMPPAPRHRIDKAIAKAEGKA